jgi:hypothetical protein
MRAKEAKTKAALALEADLNRARLEGRIVMKEIMNDLEVEISRIHVDADLAGKPIPRVTLEPGKLELKVETQRQLNA